MRPEIIYIRSGAHDGCSVMRMDGRIVIQPAAGNIATLDSGSARELAETILRYVNAERAS